LNFPIPKLITTNFEAIPPTKHYVLNL
jgi:hypothetical protein